MLRALWLGLMFALTAWACAQTTDYPGAIWRPADSTNFSVSNRPTSLPILYVVIHITEGSYAGAISWFQNPASDVSAHYVIRASDGEVTQMVRHKDIGWHAGNWTYNQRSIGIEHEGRGSNPNWATPVLYRRSADLTRHITRTYGIPRDRTRIIGHKEVPGAATACPSIHWNWSHYMQLVWLHGTFVNADVPIYLAPGQRFRVVVRMKNEGDITWEPGGSNPVLLGTQDPQDRASDFFTAGSWVSVNRAARPTANVAPGQTGEFAFDVTAPANPGFYRESFQLVKEMVTWFGPVVTLNLDVRAAERVVDNRSPAARFVGAWNTGTFAGRWAEDYRWAPTNPRTVTSAVYALNPPQAGWYDVEAWWNSGSNRSTFATYEIRHTVDGTLRVQVDQTQNGARWNRLGRVYLKPKTGWVMIRPTGEAGRVVIADAVRIVGPYPGP